MPASTQSQVATLPTDLPQTSFTTSLEALRHDALIQAQVENRLHELSQLNQAGNQKYKSQRGGNVEVLMKNRVKWPHEYVLSGMNKDRVSYDQLNVTQWVAGFACTIRE